jgi:hypothetical protein
VRQRQPPISRGGAGLLDCFEEPNSFSFFTVYLRAVGRGSDISTLLKILKRAQEVLTMLSERPTRRGRDDFMASVSPWSEVAGALARAADKQGSLSSAGTVAAPVGSAVRLGRP